VASLEPERRLVAQRLAISENTLRHHVTSVRQKLRLGSGRGTASVFIWALMTGIATWPPNNPAPMAALRQSQSWLRPGLRPSA
jgi:hypothetical protein